MRIQNVLMGVVFLGLSTTARAGDAPAAPPAAPEVKKTVDALNGTWTFNQVMTMAGAPPVKFVEKMDCKKVAQGRAVHCTDTSTIAGMGTMEYQFLIGYDEETKSVHVFAIGSPGEVHDHKCNWKGDKTLECEQYKGTSGGKPLTEDVSFEFDGNNATIKAVTVNKDGKVSVEGTGKRKGGK